MRRSWETHKNPDKYVLERLMQQGREYSADVCLTTNGCMYTIAFQSFGGKVVIDGDAYVDLYGGEISVKVDSRNVRITLVPDFVNVEDYEKLTVLIPLKRIVEASLREDLG